MADNWSSSVLTLTNRGDWAKWDFTIPDSTTADDFNNSSVFAAIRGAMSAASRRVLLSVVINDTISLDMSGTGDNFFSSSSWISADRFFFGEVAVGGFQTTDAALLSPEFSIVDAAPFVVGTNTIRLLSLGRYFDAVAEPIEIDCVMLDTGTSAGYTAAGLANGGDDSHAESAPASFAHTNGDPFNGALDDHGWFLKAPDATTGTAAMPQFEIVKFCPTGGGNITAKLRATEDGTTPISGLAGTYDIDTQTSQTATLDGAGEAEFTFPDFDDIVFWYAGNDDWMPLAQQVNDGFRKGCQGWHVGRIGVG